MSPTALLIIDVQVALVSGAYLADELLTNIADMADRARAAEAPVIYLQHCHDRYEPMMKGARGWRIQADVAPMSGDVVIEKRASDSFYETVLAKALESRDIRHLVICGLQTEFCVDTTVRAAISRGFNVTLASDAHSTGDAVISAETAIRHHNYTLGNLAHPQYSVDVRPSRGITFI